MGKCIMCQHCGSWFFPEGGVSLDDCPKCGRTVKVQPAPAPLQGEAEDALSRMEECAESGELSMRHFEDIGTVVESYRLLHAQCTDLARRLAEAEADLAEVRSRNSMLAVQRADAVHLAKASPTQAYQRIQQFKERAEAAERELEELKRSTK